MVKKSAIRVALDLETTGLRPEHDAILEIAAVKFRGGEVLDTFETFVMTTSPIPYRVQRLTGIKPEHLVGAPPFSAIARKLQGFLGDLPIVGHSIPFDMSFLRPRGIAQNNPLIDTFELASMLLPSLASYNLGQVAHALGILVPQDRHRAMVDAVLAMNVFLVLYDRIASIDLSLLNDLTKLDGPRAWPLRQFLRQELRERQEHYGLRGAPARGSLGDRFAAQLGMDPRIFSLALARKVEAVPAPAAAEEEIDRTLAALAQAHTIVEANAQEAAPAVYGYDAACQAVHQAFQERGDLLLDISIGGYNYTPALLPALEWILAGQAHPEEPARRLVIACASEAGARRLVETILPSMQNLLKSQLSVAYLAERNGYLCTHRWFGTALHRMAGEATADQARGLGKLGIWVHQTLTGERSEITLLPQEMPAWDRVSAGIEHMPTNPDQCPYRRQGYCFVALAEERVKAANIVVTTHGGLFADFAYKHALLADIEARLILDADLLEDENARWSSSECEQARLLGLLNMIGTEVAEGRYQGLLALAAPFLRENGPGGLARSSTIPKAELDARLLSWFQALRQAKSAIEKLFACFTLLLEEHGQQSASSKGRGEATGRAHNHRNANERTDQQLRLTSQTCRLGAWAETERTWNLASQRLQAVIDFIDEIEKQLAGGKRTRARSTAGNGEETSVVAEFVAAAYQLTQQKELLQRALSLGESEMVYWLRMPQVPSSPHQRADTSALPAIPMLCAQLAQTAAFLKRVLLRDQLSTIFAGTALCVDHSFTFMRNRFGLESNRCPAVSVLSEHRDQTLLYSPNDVPEPNSPQYQRHLDEALIQLATALGGQLVVLFTSHAALRASCSAIKSVLESRDILVLGHGIDGSPRQLWQVFQSQERVVLLGTGNFWDSLEEISKLPTCLFIARLPMPVLNDATLAARAERYSDQLHQFTVPLASLRVRRALNRLAWSTNKRNAVVLFDRRIISKEYGAIVLHSLPHCSQRQGAVSHMPETILNWLASTGAWEDSSVGGC